MIDSTARQALGPSSAWENPKRREQEYLGSVQFGVQYAYTWLQPWVSGTGPRQANAYIVFTQVRYHVP